MSHDELSFVEWLRRHNPRHPAIELGIGDDMGIARTSTGRVLLSSDLILDGVHFDSRTQSFERIGRKALARALSDCAAMAVKPVAATVSVALPQELPLGDAEALYHGLWEAGRQFAVGIIGGDTARWDQRLAVDVVILAEPFEGIEPVTRAGACVGDRLFVSGKLGGSILGHHLEFTPRIHEAERLAVGLGSRLHAMIDISDGLSLDLWRICQASGVGAELDETMLAGVVSQAATQLAVRDGRPAVEHVLEDGEDYELLLAVEGNLEGSPVPLFPVGRVVADGFLLRESIGAVRAIHPKGFTH